MIYLKLFWACFLILLLFSNHSTGQDRPEKHNPIKSTAKPNERSELSKPAVKKETNTLAEALLLGLDVDSLVKAGTIVPKKGYSLIYHLKNPFDWQKMSVDSVELYALTVAGKKRLLSARIYSNPSNKFSWHERLNHVSQSKIHQDIHIDTSFKVGGNLPFESQPSNVVIKKMYGNWVDGYIETHTAPDKPFIIDVCRKDLMTRFTDHNGPDFYRSHIDQSRFDTMVKVTESPECLNLNELYKAVFTPFELTEKLPERLYVKILVSETGGAENIVFLRKPDPIAAAALISGLTHLRFKPAFMDKKKIPFWVTLPILIDKKKEEKQ